jgi:glycosyltransferase involved in cell wall biosynthesis
MLEPWALNHHGWKKKAAWHLYQKRILRQASLLHATSEMEADNLRALGLDAPIAVIPNGVPLPRTWKASASGDGAADAPRRALFLSRVHPKKGLMPLVDAWADVRPDGWELVIAGPSEGGHRAEVEERVGEHGLEDAVRFTGPIPDADKWDLYRASDLFVLPTFSENFGVVVAEALASGIPAITTTGAPWHELDTHDCGWWIDPGAAPLADALADATSRSDDDRRAMGRRGRALVEDRYSWEHVAAQMAEAYRWLVHDAPRPDTIRME